MLMKEDLAQLVIESVKTQTRRPIKAGERLIELDGVKTVMSADGKRIKYQVGREYSLQYGRGLPTRLWHENENDGLMSWDFYQDGLAQHGKEFLEIAKLMHWHPLRIKLLDVWAEDVREISYEDSKFEGFSGADEFLVTWANFYDATLKASWEENYRAVLWIGNGGEGFASDIINFDDWLITNRPDGLYQAWALKFEVVKP
jgi:hypothetical protein